MKKCFKMAAIALTAMALMTACNQKAAEEPVDTMPIEEVALEEVDTIVEEEPVVEEVTPAPAKKATPAKKAEVKEEKKGLTIEVGETQVEVTEEAVKVAPLKKKK